MKTSLKIFFSFKILPEDEKRAMYFFRHRKKKSTPLLAPGGFSTAQSLICRKWECVGVRMKAQNIN